MITIKLVSTKTESGKTIKKNKGTVQRVLNKTINYEDYMNAYLNIMNVIENKLHLRIMQCR